MIQKKYLMTLTSALALGSMTALAQPPQQGEQDTTMGFFITSSSMGNGGDLGGLAGADAHCTALAEAAGVTGRTWRAYLSTSGPNGVNARDRIALNPNGQAGAGPWYNAEGELVANGVVDLHYSNANFTKERALNEKGELVNGVGDQPNRHDILTGSNPDGTATDLTCNNWTSSSGEDRAMVGHFDRIGGGPLATSWNASHPSRGCSQENLRASGGEGYFYCFAID